MGNVVKFDEKTKKALKDKEFIRRILACETGGDVRRVLGERGIVFTPSELDKFAEVLVVALERGPELTEEDLSKVVGGINMKAFEGIISNDFFDGAKGIPSDYRKGYIYNLYSGNNKEN